MKATRSRVITTALIVVSAISFAIGVTIERNGEHHESRPAAAAMVTGPGADSDHDTNTNTDADTDQAPTGDEDADTSGGAQMGVGSAGDSEDLFGVNTESTALVVVVVIASVILAGALLTVGSAPLAVLIGLAMAVFAAFDVREVVHQLGISHTGLAALAVAVAVLHSLAAGGAIATVRTTTQAGPA